MHIEAGCTSSRPSRPVTTQPVSAGTRGNTGQESRAGLPSSKRPSQAKKTRLRGPLQRIGKLTAEARQLRHQQGSTAGSLTCMSKASHTATLAGS